jgi:hypothetical protein
MIHGGGGGGGGDGTVHEISSPSSLLPSSSLPSPSPLSSTSTSTSISYRLNSQTVKDAETDADTGIHIIKYLRKNKRLISRLDITLPPLLPLPLPTGSYLLPTADKVLSKLLISLVSLSVCQFVSYLLR